MKVTFGSKYSAFQVIAPKGTLISYTETPTEVADGVYVIGDDGAISIDDQLTDTLYLSTVGSDYTVTDGKRVAYPLGDTSVIIRANISAIPFKGGAKGGESGGGTHYRGTTTTALSNGSTTNPITIDGESYTAVFGDIVVYGYTEFVFDGTTWSEFGRPFDTTPTSGSANAVTSDGIYNAISAKPHRWMKGGAMNSAVIGADSGTGNTISYNAFNSVAIGYHATVGVGAENALSAGQYTSASQRAMTAIGRYNSPRTGDLFNVGNGIDVNNRSNILEANLTSVNINGDIRKNNVSLPTPYTTMPTITESMLGQVAQYLGATDANYTKGWFYEAVSDGEETPTYSWEVINFPKSGEGGDVVPSGYPTLEYVRCNGDYAGFTVPYVIGWRDIHEVITAITSLSSESAFSGIGGNRCEGYYTIQSSEPYLNVSSLGKNVDLCAGYDVTYDTPKALRFVPSYDYGSTTYFSIGYYNTGYYPFTGRIYRYRVYVANSNRGATVDEMLLSNSIYLNFVPCKRLSDDKIGFYETVNGEFYSSTTAGAEFLEPVR